MARFPKSEADIVALAQAIRRGLAAYTNDYPAPPVAGQPLQALISAYVGARNVAIGAQAAAEQATAKKDDALEDLSRCNEKRHPLCGKYR